MIQTERLCCEPVTAAHADAMFPVLSDKRIYTYPPDKTAAATETVLAQAELLCADWAA